MDAGHRIVGRMQPESAGSPPPHAGLPAVVPPNNLAYVGLPPCGNLMDRIDAMKVFVSAVSRRSCSRSSSLIPGPGSWCFPTRSEQRRTTGAWAPVAESPRRQHGCDRHSIGRSGWPKRSNSGPYGSTTGRRYTTVPRKAVPSSRVLDASTVSPRWTTSSNTSTFPSLLTDWPRDGGRSSCGERSNQPEKLSFA